MEKRKKRKRKKRKRENNVIYTSLPVSRPTRMLTTRANNDICKIEDELKNEGDHNNHDKHKNEETKKMI